MPRYRRGFDVDAAFAYLRKRDRALGAWMRRIGPIEADARWRKSFDPVDALARAILYQQLSGKAAATIVGRVEAAIASDRLHADTLGRIDDVALRACGVSGNKALALRDLARREAAGEIPDLRRMATMQDGAIIDALVPTRGIGRWTVEMMLMFRLGRADVLPIDDPSARARSASTGSMPCRRRRRSRSEASDGGPIAPTRASTSGGSPTCPTPDPIRVSRDLAIFQQPKALLEFRTCIVGTLVLQVCDQLPPSPRRLLGSGQVLFGFLDEHPARRCIARLEE